MTSEERVFRGAYYRPLADALARARAQAEEALESELLIVDPHHHFLDGPRGRYLPADLAADAAGHRVEQTVFIDSGVAYRADFPAHLQPVGETDWVARLVAGRPPGTIAAGIVGHADLDLGDRIEEVVAAHLEASGGRFRGVRDLVHHEPGAIGSFSTRRSAPGRMGNASFRDAARRLGQIGFSLDIWAFHSQLEEVATLARCCPDTTIVLNHLGTPLGVGRYARRREEVFQAWRRAICELAERPNVRVKVGGLGMPYAGFTFHFPETAPASETLARAWTPYVETVCALFGAERCMFESNYPADAQTCAYGSIWNAFKRITAGWLPVDRTALFSGTARATYRI